MKKTLAIIATTMVAFLYIGVIDVHAAAADDVLAAINSARVEAGLSALVADETLREAAEVRAQECSQKFSHTRPNGSAWYTVSLATNGENLAHASNERQSEPENVVLAWMLSPSHKANVLRKSTTAVGIAYYSCGDGNTYIACEFN